MTTLAQLTDLVLSQLQGDSLDLSEQTYLTEDITESDTTLMVDDASQLSAGLAEIDDELIWIKSIDRNTSTVEVTPFGRGYRGTTAISHSAGAAILNSPRYSRVRVKAAINEAIEGVYPDLFVIKSVNFPYVAARYTYELPADCEQVHSLAWESIGPSRTWIPINQFRFNPNADADEFPSGKTIDIWEGIVPGRDVRVTYLTSPGLLENDADQFSTTTGLAASAKEAVIYGACHRLVGFLEPARLQMTAVESSSRSEIVQAGASINAAKFFFGLYLEALNKERERLLRLYPSMVYRTRRLV